MKRTLQQKLYVNQDQISTIDLILSSCKDFYNYLISIDLNHKQLFNKFLSRKELFRECAKFKNSDPSYSFIHSHLFQDVAKRLYLARQAAWNRAKSKKLPFKYPRIKERFRSIWFKELNNGCKILSNSSVSFNSIILKFNKTKDISNIKYIGITKKLSGYYVNLYYEENVIFKFNQNCMNNYSSNISLPEEESRIPIWYSDISSREDTVGVDFGCKTFLTFSDGTTISLPKRLFDISKYIDYLNSIKEKKQKNSNRTKKLQLQIAKLHDKISRIRDDFLHKLSKYIIQRYNTVIFEDLDIENLVYKNFSKINRKIYNSGFATLVKYLLYKVENTGKEIFQVNPAYTSQACWKCYNIKKKELSERVHKCERCGEEIDRDLNSAKVIRDIWKNGIDLEKIKEEQKRFGRSLRRKKLGQPISWSCFRTRYNRESLSKINLERELQHSIAGPSNR